MWSKKIYLLWVRFLNYIWRDQQKWYIDGSGILVGKITEKAVCGSVFLTFECRINKNALLQTVKNTDKQLESDKQRTRSVNQQIA